MRTVGGIIPWTPAPCDAKRVSESWKRVDLGSRGCRVWLVPLWPAQPGYGRGCLGPFFILGPPRVMRGMAGQVSRNDAGIGVGAKCPPARSATSTTYITTLASFGTPLKGSWVFGECCLASVHPKLPFPHDLSTLCFRTGALLRMSSHLTRRCTVSAVFIGCAWPLTWDPAHRASAGRTHSHLPFAFQEVLLTHLAEVQV